MRRTPKRGNTQEEYEDAYAVRRLKGGNRLYIALADGATETSFSAQWAQKLVKSHVKRAIRNQRNLQLRVETLSKRWNEEVDALNLPWYAEEKARRGAFSSLLAVEIDVGSNRPSRSGIWRALAVGDSCLMQIRAGKLLESFPVKVSSDFGLSPALISSRTASNATLWQSELPSIIGRWRAGDRLFLATDALAAWFLAEHEHGREPWKPLYNAVLAGKAGFSGWVEDMRSAGLLKNDDVTCILVRL